ncbi:MAG TPA: glycine zipper domain-containing protein [Phycisphaerales bacterium]|nr:glycine zipper domain-containing protein [Phycisphaerales bacterium]HMP38195.1 glycine zipper domain-containing protein [Phycisphaerales bacterium]
MHSITRLSCAARSIRRSAFASASLALALALLAAPAGCQTSGQTGVLAGAGLGALMGQAIGGSTVGTLIGAGVGAGVGYIIGNEMDKQRSEELAAQRHREAMAAATAPRPSPGGSSVAAPVPVTHGEVGPLGGTRWQVVSINPSSAAPPHISMIVDFRGDGRALTTTTGLDGAVTVDDESYRVVGDTLILNRPGYLVNARFSIAGDQLVVSSDRFSAVLRRLPG